MAQNTSSAVMAQRAEPNDSLDFFPTPPWATRALFEHVIGPKSGYLGWDPACGDGAMVNVMDEYMLACAASDVHDYGLERAVQHDFLMPYAPEGITFSEFIITNPPFVLGEQFVKRALELATHGVAMLVRTAFLESGPRYRNLFRKRPPALVAQFVERVIMAKGILRDPNKLYWDPKKIDRKTGKHGAWRRPSSATAYCWLVWDCRGTPADATRLVWIPPCRKKLERPGDYPQLSPGAPELPPVVGLNV